MFTDLPDDDFIDDEPSDLWDFSDEESLTSPENLSEDNIELTNEDTSLWDDNFPEIDDEGLVDEEIFTPEEINSQNDIVKKETECNPI